MAFPFELLDIYLGAWAACFLPLPEADLRPAAADECPENCGHLQVLLRYFHDDAEALLAAVTPDLRLRGLQAVAQPEDLRAPAADLVGGAGSRPGRSCAGVAAADAEEVLRAPRLLQLTGGPGTGKTEVAIEAAIRVEDGCRVLLVGPIGLLVNAHRGKIPPDLDIVVETVHAAFKIGRDRDAHYIPPGRLRNFDLIIFDEVSQLDASVWLRRSPSCTLCPSWSSSGISSSCKQWSKTWRGIARVVASLTLNYSLTRGRGPRTRTCSTSSATPDGSSQVELPWRASSMAASCRAAWKPRQPPP